MQRIAGVFRGIRSGSLTFIRRFGTPEPMDLTSFHVMDPHLLVGLVNTELRNHCDSLDDLVKTHGIDEAALVEKLANADYSYQAGQNQFR